MPNTKITTREIMQHLLEKPGNKYAIYQVKDSDPGNMMFNDLDMMRERNINPTMDKYDLVFVAEVYGTQDLGNHDERQDFLEHLYFRLNNDKVLQGFRGHSLSVSDVVAIRYNGETSYWFCDSVGFIQIPFVEEAAV